MEMFKKLTLSGDLQNLYKVNELEYIVNVVEYAPTER
jgi:hypothetical protein